VNIRLDAILAPTRLKVHGTNGSDALWLHPGYVHGENSVGRDLGSNPVKGSWYKIGGRALTPPGSW